MNDVKSISLYDESGIGDKYLVTILKSYLIFKILREFFNSTVAIQINDIRKLPIKIPSQDQLEDFEKKFNECVAIKKAYFSGEIGRAKMNALLQPIEAEIDKMVNRFYGIELREEAEEEVIEAEVMAEDENGEEDDE